MDDGERGEEVQRWKLMVIKQQPKKAILQQVQGRVKQETCNHQHREVV